MPTRPLQSVLKRPAPELCEQAGYLQVNGINVYCVRHHAAGDRRGAVLLIGAMALERSHSYLTLVRWSRMLAHAGFDVLRFDYRGVGESEGDFSQMTLLDWEQDARACLQWLRELCPRTPICLHGLRLGAVFASRLFREELSDGLLLWDPPTDARGLLADTLRRKLAADYMEHTGQTRMTREHYIAALERGELVEVEGYPWSRGLWRSADGMTVLLPDHATAHGPAGTCLCGSRRPTCVIHLDGRGRERCLSLCCSQTIRIPRPPFWLESRTLVPDLSELLETSRAFLCAAAERAKTKPEGMGAGQNAIKSVELIAPDGGVRVS